MNVRNIISSMLATWWIGLILTVITLPLILKGLTWGLTNLFALMDAIRP